MLGSGGRNANTACNFTNYYFSIKPDKFTDALDRFAQFFTAPLLIEDCIDREINAVDSEFKMVPFSLLYGTQLYSTILTLAALSPMLTAAATLHHPAPGYLSSGFHLYFVRVSPLTGGAMSAC